jgi:hypothetical protein
MILSDREIIAAPRRPFIRLTPEPDPSDPDIWSSTALDLRLDAKLELWRGWAGPGTQDVIDPSDPEFNATLLAAAHAMPVDPRRRDDADSFRPVGVRRDRDGRDRPGRGAARQPRRG